MSDGSPEPPSSDLESVERTPRDIQLQGPPTAEDLAPKGPPAPMPVHHDVVGHSLPSAAASDPARDSASDPGGAGEPMPKPASSRRRPREPSSSSSDDATSEHDAEGASDSGDCGERESENETGHWSDTSLVLEGSDLADACETFITLFRRQLAELQPELSSRSAGARIGALRRCLQQLDWPRVQGFATQRLEGRFLWEWLQTEYKLTHRYHTGRFDDSA
ncbi:unnamed protein product [Symbiodinium sp. CCMP2592]|nr:unnamed protein product [Symbiodinium sp. CCMP2592]